jgi:para-nitrobenzyl esterase
MASPLSRNRFQQAIGESGAFFGSVGGRGMPSLVETEKEGQRFAGSRSVAELRAIPAEQLLQEASKPDGRFSFWPNIDGYFL